MDSRTRKDYIRRMKRKQKKESVRSRTGVIAAVLVVIAIAMLVASVTRSLMFMGEGDAYVGGIGMLGLIFSFFAFLFGIVSLKERDVRKGSSAVGIIFGLIMTAVYVLLIVTGLF